MSMAWFIACPTLINQEELVSSINNVYKPEQINLQHIANFNKQKDIQVGANELNLFFSVLQISLNKRPGAAEFKGVFDTGTEVLNGLLSQIATKSKAVISANTKQMLEWLKGIIYVKDFKSSNSKNMFDDDYEEIKNSETIITPIDYLKPILLLTEHLQHRLQDLNDALDKIKSGTIASITKAELQLEITQMEQLAEKLSIDKEDAKKYFALAQTYLENEMSINNFLRFTDPSKQKECKIEFDTLKKVVENSKKNLAL